MSLAVVAHGAASQGDRYPVRLRCSRARPATGALVRRHARRFADIRAIGRDAVIVRDETCLSSPDDAPAEVGHPESRRNVVGDDVATEGGVSLGNGSRPGLLFGTAGDVVGYQISTAEGGDGYIPLPAQLAVSGSTLVVPEITKEFVVQDLVSLSAPVDDFPGPHGAGMSETFHQVVGRKVVSRSSAEELATLSDFLYDGARRSIAAIVLAAAAKPRSSTGRTSPGSEGMRCVSDDGALREPADERESQACSGKLGLLGTRALTETGNELGTVDDVVFDPGDGRVLALVVAGKERPAEGLLGAGSYAAVMAADQDPAT